MKRTKGQWLNAFIEATRAHRTDNAPITSGMLAQGLIEVYYHH